MMALKKSISLINEWSVNWKLQQGRGCGIHWELSLGKKFFGGQRRTSFTEDHRPGLLVKLFDSVNIR
jgi:hypothetical protein